MALYMSQPFITGGCSQAKIQAAVRRNYSSGQSRGILQRREPCHYQIKGIQIFIARNTWTWGPFFLAHEGTEVRRPLLATTSFFDILLMPGAPTINIFQLWKGNVVLASLLDQYRHFSRNTHILVDPKREFLKATLIAANLFFYCAEHAICHRRREQDTHISAEKKLPPIQKRSLKRVDDKKTRRVLTPCVFGPHQGQGTEIYFYLPSFIRKDFPISLS